MKDAAARSRRAFYALWPDPATAHAIARLPGSGADPVHEDDLHLTIAFVGGVTAREYERLPALAAALRAAPFTLHLNDVRYWAASHARVLVPERVPPALTALRMQLLRRLADAGLAVARPGEAEFRPHVTLARSAAASAATGPGPGVDWQVTGITLAVTEPVRDGRHYRRVATLDFVAGDD